MASAASSSRDRLGVFLHICYVVKKKKVVNISGKAQHAGRCMSEGIVELEEERNP